LKGDEGPAWIQDGVPFLEQVERQEENGAPARR